MINQIKNICCIGAGYVGGPTMAVIAKKCPHIEVNVVDINEDRIKKWNSENLAELPIYEPGLSTIIRENRGVNLYFSSNINQEISRADLIFISVNTPTKQKGVGAGQASDLKWIEASARRISEFAKDKTIVVEKSTLPVKTAQTIKEILEVPNSKSNNGKTFYVLSNPEFLAEGTAIDDLENPDRVLIGGEDKEPISALVEIYLNWVDKSKIITTDLWSSELSKLISNAFLAQRISSINSISALCETTGANINEVAKAIGADKRIGELFLNAGPGFGGSCFKKDILNLIYICNHYGLFDVSAYWQKVIDIDNWQRKRISNLIVQRLFGTVSGKKIGILGFSFKANTNDTRESPAISICKDLIEEGALIHIFDPQVDPLQISNDLNLKESTENSSLGEDGKWVFAPTILDAARDADALIIITNWHHFNNINWGEIASVMRFPSWLIDTRSQVKKEKVESFGIKVWQLGNGV